MSEDNTEDRKNATAAVENPDRAIIARFEIRRTALHYAATHRNAETAKEVVAAAEMFERFLSGEAQKA